MAAAELTNEQARQVLGQILNTPEFVQGSLRDKLEAFFRQLLGGPALPAPKTNVADGAFWLAVIIGLIGLGLVIYLIWKVGPVWRMIGREARAGQEQKREYSRPTPAGLLAEAETKAARQEFRGALRAVYLAALLELDNRRLIHYAAAKTNSEYLRELSRSGTGLERRFRSLAELFEYKWYGLEGCSGEDFQAGRALYAALIREGSDG